MNYLKAMLLIVIMGMCVNTYAGDTTTVITKGTTPEGYVRLKSTTNSSGVTTTKGTINGKYTRTKTRNGVTKGTVGGEPIRLKSKATSDTFEPDWDPDW